MFELQAEKRDVFGKRLSKCRQAGKLPIVMYGGAKEGTRSYFVSAREFEKIFREAGESSIISISAPHGTREVLVHAIDRNPVSGEITHADFYVVEGDKPIEVTVPLVFRGVAPAVKNLGGILVRVMQELPIEVLPKDIPHEIVVDISSLTEMDSQILVKNIALPQTAHALAEEDEVIANISIQEEEKPETVQTPDFTQIAVEKKGKKETETEGGNSK
ncbi:MAG: 50S ribosomal protein L25 [Candidatus Vogelbacteria bacterium]|nr:50S ribosomal protein L25 [Candidatus Vogelbacteria bacterium]